jgi:hypothetical protein
MSTDRGEARRRILGVIERLPNESKLPAAWVSVDLSDEPDQAISDLAASADPILRAAVARFADLVNESGEPTPLGEQLALDPERQPQLAALDRFREVTNPSRRLVELIQRVADREPQPFVCSHCGTDNAADTDYCANCRIVTRTPPQEAAKLVDEMASSIGNGALLEQP